MKSYHEAGKSLGLGEERQKLVQAQSSPSGILIEIDSTVIPDNSSTWVWANILALGSLKLHCTEVDLHHILLATDSVCRMGHDDTCTVHTRSFRQNFWTVQHSNFSHYVSLNSDKRTNLATTALTGVFLIATWNNQRAQHFGRTAARRCPLPMYTIPGGAHTHSPGL